MALAAYDVKVQHLRGSIEVSFSVRRFLPRLSRMSPFFLYRSRPTPRVASRSPSPSPGQAVRILAPSACDRMVGSGLLVLRQPRRDPRFLVFGFFLPALRVLYSSRSQVGRAPWQQAAALGFRRPSLSERESFSRCVHLPAKCFNIPPCPSSCYYQYVHYTTLYYTLKLSLPCYSRGGNVMMKPIAALCLHRRWFHLHVRP